MKYTVRERLTDAWNIIAGRFKEIFWITINYVNGGYRKLARKN